MKTQHTHTAVIVRTSGTTVVPAERLEDTLRALGYTISGYKADDGMMKPERIGQPMAKGLVGPMYGDRGVVRYEDGDTYNFLST